MNALQTISNATADGYWDLPPEGAAEHLARFRIVDVREPDEYHGPLGHLVGAELIPMGGFPSAADGWEQKRPVLLVCRSGKRSGRVAALLAQQGFAEIYNLIGGMLVWNELGLPLERA